MIAASSLLAVVYVARIVLPLWQSADEGHAAETIQLPGNISSMLLLSSAACVLFGLWPAPLLSLCEQAAQALLP